MALRNKALPHHGFEFETSKYYFNTSSKQITQIAKNEFAKYLNLSLKVENRLITLRVYENRFFCVTKR